MAEDGRKCTGHSSGLASILSDGNLREVSQRSHLVSYYDDLGNQSVERTIEYIMDLAHKSIRPASESVDVRFIRSLLRNKLLRLETGRNMDFINLDGVLIYDCGFGSNTVAFDSASICGEIRNVREPLFIESLAVFSSARANACVWKGKWMYEVTLETAGVQQLGWATVSCPFTDRKGVGDAEDSYAFDGKRVSKWNKYSKAYGQSWVVGDVIGCCIDLYKDTISFYRNGAHLGVAFDRIRKMAPGDGYYPALSLSEGESCELNFGSHPFMYPIDDFHPIQVPPSSETSLVYLFRCLSRLLEVKHMDKSNSAHFEKMRRLKRFAPIEELYHPISHSICEELFAMIRLNEGCCEYISWAVLLPFVLEVFGSRPPHDYASLDLVMGLLFEFDGHTSLFQHLLMSLSFSCKTAPIVLVNCPYSGSYPFLALACHILRKEGMMTLLWQSLYFELSLEGFFSIKNPSKQDLHYLIPSVWWPGSSEDAGSENGMILTSSALSGTINKIEDKHRELCCLIIRFIPSSPPGQLPGSVFRNFLQNLILKVKGAEHKISPSDTSSNSTLISLYTAILHFLSEGFAVDDLHDLMGFIANAEAEPGFLHRGGKRKFPVELFLNSNPHRSWISRLGGSTNHLLKVYPVENEENVIWWDEGCMDDHDTSITHSTRKKPCCCSSSKIDTLRASKDGVKHLGRRSKAPCTSIPDRSVVMTGCVASNLNDDALDKPGSSDQRESEFGYQVLQNFDIELVVNTVSLDVLSEVELLDLMLFLYHLGVAPKFRQAFYCMSHQSQSISLIDDTDKQIREKSCAEQLKKLKKARKSYHEELIDCVRLCTWYRISLFSRWKQRGMYATCMWVVEMLSVLSNAGPVFHYIPEFYIESLVDCFHALRKSDPPYVSSSIFIKQGLASFITFVVKHFNDPRILSTDVKDLLLQSISVLVQYSDYLLAFESNKEAVNSMPRALLLAFDSRSWIPVTNILIRLCKGSGFGFSKHLETSSSVLFQVLLREVCVCDEELFFSFLNRLFNTLSWTMTEFSVTIREMQESYQIGDLQQRKCTVVFELSCNLSRVLEFYTREIPQAFVQGPDMNLRRLAELIIFILNHMISVADTEFFDSSLRRPSQFQEKTNRSMIMAPLVGIILNLMDATAKSKHGEMIDIIGVFSSMECPLTVHCGFQYLLAYNWGNVLRGEASLTKLSQLEDFVGYLRSRITPLEETAVGASESEGDSCCCICYAADSDAQFEPCGHLSCLGCITRHLLNCQRCFFCNATVVKVVSLGLKADQSSRSTL